MRIALYGLFAAILLSGPVALGADDATADAQKMLQKATSNSTFKWKYTGEQFAWNSNADLHSFLRKYEATGDEAYLDAGVKYYDAVLAKMATGPDGYRGFIGPFIYKNSLWCDVHVGDALMFDGILDFAAKVVRDPKLKAKYGKKAQEYAAVVQRDFFEKWDSRGTWRTDGPFGFYVAWDKYGQPGQLTDWKPESDAADKSDNSLPFNKQIDCGAVALRMWQITGDAKYKDRAERLYGFMKSRMQNYNGGYHWNYWEPATQSDLGVDDAAIKSGEWNPKVASKTMRHWINVHGHRNYQSNEMANIVKAYNAGIVWTEADIRGMIHTNLKVMWNGDEASPKFANSNNDLLGLTGQADAYNPPKTKDKAGEPWAPLGQFDETIRKLSAKWRGAPAPTDAAPPSFARRDVTGNVEVTHAFDAFPNGNIRIMHMACALPSVFALGERSAICCKVYENCDLEVALFSTDGKNKIATLKQGQVEGGHDGREGVNYFLFDGKLPDGKTVSPGDYRIRWTVKNDGFREFPITIQPKRNP
jgi:hypothetical protein